MDALLEVLLTVVFYGVGRVIVSIVSLGFVRGEGWHDDKLTFPWYCLTKDANGKPVVSNGFCRLIGGLAVAAAVIAAIVMYSG